MKRTILAFGLVFGVALTVSESAWAQGGGESWPQKFEVVHGEPSGFAFIASQPGPISITVRSQGVPLTLSLSGPTVQPIETSGAGILKLDYAAKASDVARSSIWVIQIREQGAPASVPSARQPMIIDQNTPKPAGAGKLTVVASGTIAVVHPAGDLNRANSEMSAKISARPASAPTLTLSRQLLEQRKTQYLQGVAAAQAIQKQQIEKLFPASAAKGAPVPQVPSAAKAGNTSLLPRASSGTPGGSSQATPPPSPSLALTSVSVSAGYAQPGATGGVPQLQPGDYITVTGSGFGDNPCPVEVHFVLNPGIDVMTQMGYGWFGCGNGYFVPNEIFVQVPGISGAAAQDGRIYLHRGQETTASLPFHFKPAMDFLQLTPQCNDPDAKIAQIDFSCPNVKSASPAGEWWVWHDGQGLGVLQWDLLGHKGEDLYYSSVALKNGWVVDSVAIICGNYGTDCPNANPSVLVSGVGTPSLFVDVHWWMDPVSMVLYNLVVNIRGPRGTPYR